jgi:TolB-like protein
MARYLRGRGYLGYQIFQLRKALGQSPDGRPYIETVPKRGYRFAAPVTESSEEQDGEHGIAAAAGPPTVGVQASRKLGWLVAAAVLSAVVVAAYLASGGFWRAPSPGKVMLAVLPFDNLSGDSDQEYLGDGLTEEMISQLGTFEPERLGVIARTSIRQYKGSPKPVDQIGRELRVDYVVEGGFRRDNGRVRVSVRLIQVSDQTHLWAENYERDWQDVLLLQSEVARAIARKIHIAVSPEETQRFARTGRVDPEAYEAYLRGRFHLEKYSSEHFETARRYFQLALDKDPSYALPHAGIARGLRCPGAVGRRRACRSASVR